jgi:hypothetical protein
MQVASLGFIDAGNQLVDNRLDAYAFGVGREVGKYAMT